MPADPDDNADPGPPSGPAPTLGSPAALVVLGIFFALMRALAWSRYW